MHRLRLHVVLEDVRTVLTSLRAPNPICFQTAVQHRNCVSMATEIPGAHQFTISEAHCRLVHSTWSGSPSGSQCVSYPSLATPEPATQPGASQPQAYIRSQETGGTFSEYTGSAGPRPSSSRAAPPRPDKPPAAAWHPQKPYVAMLDSRDRALVYDMAKYEAAPAHGTTQATPFAVDQPRLILEHELQIQACSLSWRPHCGSQLAVGCQGGVALWCTSGTSRAPVAGSRSADGPATSGASRPGGGRGPWLTFLPCGEPNARLLDLAWSPDGRILAAASPDLRGLLVWDVATGVLTRIAAGFSCLRLLRWAPSGGHLFTASHGNLFYLFETGRWRYQAWDAAGTALPLPLLQPARGGGTPAASQAAPSLPGRAIGAVNWLLHGGRSPGVSAAAGLGSLVQASWAPSSRIVLMAFAGSQSLLALHVVGDAPSLQAQPMPVTLPDITPGQSSAERLSSGSPIADFVWDPRGERLGVLLAGAHPAAGCIALFQSAYDPVVHARLLGFARPAPQVLLGGAAGLGSVLPAEAWSLSAHHSFLQGAVFTVRMSNTFAYNLPMYR